MMAGFFSSYKRRMRDIELSMQRGRTNLYSFNTLLALMGIMTFLMSCVSLGDILQIAEVHKKYLKGSLLLLWSCLVAILLPWPAFIWFYCARRQMDVAESRRAAVNQNLYMFKKSFGQVLTLGFFAYLDTYLDAHNRFWIRFLCVSVYMHLVLLMVIFRIREDFDLCFGFLAAAYTMFYDASETLEEQLLLGAVMWFLCSLKNYLIDGKGIRPMQSVSRLPRDRRELIKQQPVRTSNKVEETLSEFRTRWYLMYNLNVMCTFLTFWAAYMGCCTILNKTHQEQLNRHAGALEGFIALWAGFCILYGWGKCTDPGEDKEDPVNLNLHMLKKSLGQVVTLGLFTYLDKYLLAQGIWVAIIVCVGLYLHIVFLLVLFRVREDFDCTGGCLAAGFGVFYKFLEDRLGNKFSKEKLGKLVVLALVTVLLSCLKNYLIGGRGVAYSKNAGTIRPGREKRKVESKESKDKKKCKVESKVPKDKKKPKK